MWRDSESDTDFLNFTDLAEQIATLATNPTLLPISIGVFGTWGTGKSTVLHLAERRLENVEKPSLVIKFDAWLYQGFDDAKAALMEVVAERLLTESRDREGLVEKAKQFASRINYFRALGLAADFGVGMALGVPPGLLTRAGGAIGTLITGTPNQGDLEVIKEGGRAAIDEWSELIRPEEARTPPKEIDAFRREFGELLTGLDQTLVLFIDNLDRCLPDVAIGTLEAVRLFLFMEGTAFVIAADEDMIRHSVAKHFNDPNAKHVHDYLDKVIQVPLQVPQVGSEDVRAYMYSLFVTTSAPEKLGDVQGHLLAALQESWQGKTFTRDEVNALAGSPPNLLEALAVADRLAPILAAAPSIGGNPRIVKRLLNAVTLRQTLAASRKMNVDLATLAKLAVFERGTDAAAAQQLYRLVMEEEGAENLLMPTAGIEGEQPDLPTEWKKYETFIDQWREMEPLFNNTAALRPAVFLSRDVMAPAVRRGGLSEAAHGAVAALLKVTSVNSPAAREVVAALSAPDQAAAMGALVTTLRERDWTQPVPGIHGALVLARASEVAEREFRAFVETLQIEAMHRATRFLLQQGRFIERTR